MWYDPSQSAYLIPGSIPGELHVSDQHGAVVAHVVYSAEPSTAYVQDASHVNVGSVHAVDDRIYERDVSGVNQGSFHRVADGSFAHHLPNGVRDYTVDAAGHMRDAMGVLRGSADPLAAGRFAVHRCIGDASGEGELPVADVPEQPRGAREPLVSWKPELVQHPQDRAATETLRKLPFFSSLAQKFQEYGHPRAQAVNLVGTGLLVSDRQMPSLYRIYRETAEVLGVRMPPALYVTPGGINAYTFEAHEPYVVLQSGLVSCFNEMELRFALGHEFGHVLLGHVRYTLMAESIGLLVDIASQATLGIGGLVGKGFQLALLHWARNAELSCDRIGLLAVQDSGTAGMTALMKMAGAPFRYYQELDLGAFLDQARAFEKLNNESASAYHKFMSGSVRDHPWCVARASELLTWIEAGGPAGAIAAMSGRAELGVASATGESAPLARSCPKCGAPRAPKSSMCWAPGCLDTTPLGACPSESED